MNNQPPQPASGPDREQREREIEEQHHREQHIMRQQALQQQQQQEEMAQRRAIEESERQRREQYNQSVPQHQNDTRAIPLHQPVASRLPGAIHSPGGLLANHSGPPQGVPLGAPPGPGNAFGGPLHNDANRSMPQLNPQNAVAQQQHQMFGPAINHVGPPPPPQVAPNGPPGFGGPLQPDAAARSMQQMPFGQPVGGGHPAQGASALGQGQQPILNDALSYLDQVKVQFVDQPDVYNRFLDIMKDFKSQAIDTPGVINRVSELFAGHPNLIQGFNTFLPPGYRIECGTGSDPNTIRVTTPMGTTVQSITGAGRALPDASQMGANGGFYASQPRGNNWNNQAQHSIESPEAAFSPQIRNGVPPSYAQTQASNAAAYEAQQAAANAHQQEQRGVSQLQNAIATVHPAARSALTPTPTSGTAGNGSARGGDGAEKRGPVEFNHAISYVNKIKNRFQDKPEIYKQFLEILQTYQRESKPIQDVYAQVTTLFNTAPDLLEDFKQFLPESAAQAKAAAAKAAEDAAIGLAGVSQTPQAPRLGGREQKLPPVGNFMPPSTTKDGKKRPRPAAAAPVPMSALTDAANSRSNLGPGGPTNKRLKTVHPARAANDEAAPPVSPTLTPQKPQPMSPKQPSQSRASELQFFDKVKKFLSNKQIFAEFLKLCNLFSQDLIDKNVLVHKVSNFIGQNTELMDFFKRFVDYTGQDEVVENRPRPPTEKVSLSNCRGLGPSYRLLPKRERLKPCSGRDEMCYSILNDDWASHPTWASEDSGFVAHRKNHFEEGLHRIEEERHDYDFNIEANAKVIQLLEPVAHQILNLQPQEMQSFRMPQGFGGQSQSIYKRIFKKIYGVEKGNEVTQELFKDPIAVVPVVLARLKQKDEEWRFTQREWDKVWHVQTQAMYLKSLDHMGISVKSSDKKLLAPRAMTELIRNKHEEQRRARANKLPNVPRYQFAYDMDDEDVIADTVRLAILYVMNAHQHSPSERDRIAEFLETFIPAFFGMSVETVRQRVSDISRGSPDEDMEDQTPAELTNGRSRRANGKMDHNLLRGVLERGRNGTRGARGQKESSVASGSKESTPDTGSPADDEETAPEPMDVDPTPEVSNERWLGKSPDPTVVAGTGAANTDDGLKADQPFIRESYSLYCNLSVFQFFSIFEVLYRRLKAVKDSEAATAEEVKRIKAPKPAKELGLLEERNDWFSQDSPDSYYSRALLVVEDFILGEIEEVKYQDFLRTYYLKKGWMLYTINELLKNICRFAATCSSNDSKEKTPSIIASFLANRAKDETTYNQEIDLRKKVEKIVGDADMYLIKYYPTRRRATTQLITKDETTFDLTDMERKDRWKYYTSSFVRIEPTEGVPMDRVRKSVLTRNLPNTETLSDACSALEARKPLSWSEDLTLRICVNTYRLTYKEGTSEWFVYSDGKKIEAAVEKARERRNDRFKKLERNNTWITKMKKTPEEVADINENFKKWLSEGGGPAPVAE